MDKVLEVLLEIKKEIHESYLQHKEVFSLQEFCKYADISDDYGYKLIRERKIRFSRPGGKRIYIDRSDAIAFLKQNPVNSADNITMLAANNFFTSKINKHAVN